MKIVDREPVVVSVSSIVPGNTFQFAGEYYISTCHSARQRDIWGVNLKNGNYVSSSTTRVTPMQIEARVL